MSALITSLKLVPKNALSYAVGATLRAPWPRPVVQSAIRGFSAVYGVETTEAEQELRSYRTFNDFFTRRLKPGLRPIAEGADVACSPVDGTVGQVGEITDGRMIQSKGKLYSLADFLVNPDDTKDYEGGTYATLYLAPYNYHRIHSPLAGRISGCTYIPGHLWPVNEKGVAEIDRLFAVNERLVTHLQTAVGKVAVAKVGATCVGRIKATYTDVVTNNGSAPYRRTRFDEQVAVDKGAELGIFEMGSTVIVLFQKGRVTLDPALVPGATIRVGQLLAKASGAKR